MKADITVDLDRDICILSESIKPLLKHTAHERKLFKQIIIKEEAQAMQNHNLGFGLKFSDKQDVAGLMQRDEVGENQLRVSVQEYLVQILSLLAFAVSTAGFQRPPVPRVSIPEEEVKSLHVDTKLINHREMEKGSQSTNALLLADSLG